ncbi:OmpA family protein [Treponema sp. OMZ 840]|uniref:OmpA family protein n=1 Tax=Treponema sp. OMZ 840 TaxID=244313 RepID=UPI003D948551
MSKLKVLLLMLFVSLFFACKSAPKNPAESKQPEQAAAEEKIETAAKEEPAQTATPAKPVEVTAKVDYTVYFAPQSYVIDRFTAQKLDTIAQALAEQKVKRIIISGHSARLNSEKDEERIALQRAIAVAQHFQATKLFDAESITVIGKGAREPAGPHTEITDRFKNRRVEIQSAE